MDGRSEFYYFLKWCPGWAQVYARKSYGVLSHR